MPLNPMIPLLAEAPDVLGSFTRGTNAADVYNKQQQEKGKRNFLQEYGEELFAGDQNALSAYAEFDLEGAQRIQATQQAQAARRAAAGRAAAGRQAAADREQEGLALAAVTELHGQGRAAFDAAIAANPDLDIGDLTFDNFQSKMDAYTGADAAISNAQARAAGPETPEFSGNVPDGYMFADPKNPRAGVMPIPGAPAAETPPADAVSAVGKVLQDWNNPDLNMTEDQKSAALIKALSSNLLSVEVGADGVVSIKQGSTPQTGESNATGKVPAGYERIIDPETGKLTDRPIRGGSVYRKIVADSKREFRALENYIASSENVESKIDRAIKIINTANVPVTGLIGWAASGVPGTPAYELNSLIGEEGTITTNESFDLLRQLKAESKTGGAVGQLSDPERRAMGAIHENLKQANNMEAVLNSLTSLKEFRSESVERLKNAYAEDFSDIAAVYGAPEGVLTVEQIKTLPYGEIEAINPATVQYMSAAQATALSERLAAGE